jgi:hypothetical protein
MEAGEHLIPKRQLKNIEHGFKTANPDVIFKLSQINHLYLEI